MRRFFTLIETAIALLFLSLLLSTLFVWYRHLSFQKKDQGVYEREVTDERYCDQQMMNLLPKCQLKPSFFTTDEDQKTVLGSSVVFYFDAGAQAESALSGTVLGRLYLDRKTKTLAVGIWPAGKEITPCQTRKLLEGVESATFFFYAPPDPFKLTVSPEAIGGLTPKEGWQEEWKKEYRTLPAMVKVVLVRTSGRSVELLYDLPCSPLSRILYSEGGT